MSDHIEIPVGIHGHRAIIDISDFDLVSQLSWSFCGYAYHYFNDPDRKPGVILMHRLTMGLDGPHVDHVNRNTLDNRRRNLRHATPHQNNGNLVKTPKETTSIYKGVPLGSTPTEMVHSIGVPRRRIGRFKSEIEAARAYNAAAMEYFGPSFAMINLFPVDLKDRDHGFAIRPNFKETTSSRFIGVTWKSDRQKWNAQICIDGKMKSLGDYQDELEAAAAFRAAEKLYPRKHHYIVDAATRAQ